MEVLPEFLEKMILEQYGQELLEKIKKGYSQDRLTTLRVNTLKTEKEKIKNVFEEKGIKYKEINWYNDALIIENVKE